jgi:adenylate cyclase
MKNIDQKKRNKPQKSYSVRYPLVIRLILIISIIVIGSVGAVTAFASYFFTDDSRARAEENNLTLTELVSQQIESETHALMTGAVSLFDSLRVSAGNNTLQVLTTDNYFDRNGKTAYISVPGEKEIYSPKFFLANELNQEIVPPFLKQNAPYIERSRAGETLLINASPSFGIPTAALIFPYRDFGTENVMVIIFSTESFQTLVQTESTNTTSIVGFDGSLIANSDFDLVKSGINLAADPVISQMITSTMDNRQIQFKDESGRKFIGAFRKIPRGQFAVITSIPYDVVNKAAYNIARNVLYLAGIVLLFSILLIWFFSKRVSSPIYTLVDASQRIEKGEFELDIQPTSRDEIGLLTDSFVQMGKGLAERERVKESFGKFVNTQIVEQALKGDVKLGGTRKNATIFFSDIRSFTAISEKMAPEAVVEFLNEYMTLMVDCIEKTGGVVDKFIGDAIMAVWGAPVSSGSAKSDALLSIQAMMLMRDALKNFNKDRGGPDKPVIRIGCGVNTGPCLAGQIGSQNRMEYTVIGDAVNLASRIESLNKPLGSDILISEQTFQLVKNEVVVCRVPNIKVKGKKDAMNVYIVLRMKDGEGPKDLNALRTELGTTEPKNKESLENEEKKYEFLQK